MGFGILLLSYLVAIAPGVSFTPFLRIVGGIGMIFALKKLYDFNSSFKFPALSCVLLVLWNIVWAGFTIGALIIGKTTIPLFSTITDLLLILTIFLILYAMRTISIEISRPDLARKNFTTMIFVVLLTIYLFLINMPQILQWQYANYVLMGYIVFTFFVLALVGIRIFSSYRHICEEGDEDMNISEPNDPLYNMIKKRKNGNKRNK